MKMKRIAMTFPVGLVEEVKTESQKYGATFSGFVRTAVNEKITNLGKKKK